MKSRLGSVLPVLILVMSPLVGGCSAREKAMRAAVTSLTSGTSTMGRDDDPELIRDSIPFGLTTMESLYDDMPDHPGLLLALVSGYTQYAYAFVQQDADLLKYDDYDRYKEGRVRAHRMYKRALRYGLEGLSLVVPNFLESLRSDPEATLNKLTPDDVKLVYWTGAAWGGAISTRPEDLDLLADLPRVRALLNRGLVLDEDFDEGAFHELFVSLDMAPAGAGAGSARAHFERALSLSQGKKAGTYIGFAEAVLVPEQDVEAFDAMLEKALAIDPDQHIDYRLVNLLSQEKARFLQAHRDDLFGG